ncbi:MAG: hemerythrin domain-containing protein [Alphaproteobacteria bacterium]|nr:hemerythrin domain-containing protein [Alphaproteobacteria bacterium]
MSNPYQTAANRTAGFVIACPPDVAQVFRDHDQMDALCALLEEIADSLPRPQADACTEAIERLERFVPVHVRHDDDVFARLIGDVHLRERLTGQHNEDLGLSQELSLALEPLAAGGTTDDPDALGYMLRCFFNGCRRSMLVEELAIQAALTPRAGPVGVPN